MLKKLLICGMAAAVFSAQTALAAEYTIILKDHQFSPAELVIPAGQKVKITVENHDATPAEFESYELNREKIIVGGGKAVIFIGPLKAGTYPYFDEFHMDTTKGTIKAQ